MNLKQYLRFEIASSAAVVASIVIMALETFDWSQPVLHALLVADISLSLLFLAEYLYRIATAENKRAYITSFYGIIDLVALLPLFSHALHAAHPVNGARVIRLLRVLRVLRLLKLRRYDEALDRFRAAISLIAAEVTLFSGVAFVFMLTFAFLIYEVEHEAQPKVYQNIFDSIWWAAISLTSVGYGDIYPVTTVGRVLTLLMVLTGMGIVAVPTALLASALSKVRAGEDASESGEPAP